MTVLRQSGSLPVWPYFFLSATAAILGAVFLAVWWPWGYPDESKLAKISGGIDTVVVRDDISKSSAGAMLPAMTSVYFRLKGVDGEFRYPSTHPKYPLVRDYTAVAIDVWVVRTEIGTGAPLTIWQVQERNPHDAASELTYVGYAEIIERRLAIDRSMIRVGYWLLVACGGFMLLGIGVRRWNKGRPHPPRISECGADTSRPSSETAIHSSTRRGASSRVKPTHIPVDGVTPTRIQP